MKVSILVLAFVALTASVAYADPTENEDSEIEAFLNKLMKQEEASEQENHAAEMESFLAQLDNDDDEEAGHQKFFAREQIPAKLQSWFKTGDFKKPRSHIRTPPRYLHYSARVKWPPGILKKLGRR